MIDLSLLLEHNHLLLKACLLVLLKLERLREIVGLAEGVAVKGVLGGVVVSRIEIGVANSESHLLLLILRILVILKILMIIINIANICLLFVF